MPSLSTLRKTKFWSRRSLRGLVWLIVSAATLFLWQALAAQDLTQRRRKVEFAAASVRDLPGFQAIEWIDCSFYVRWIVPLAGNLTDLVNDFGFDLIRDILTINNQQLTINSFRPNMTRQGLGEVGQPLHSLGGVWQTETPEQMYSRVLAETGAAPWFQFPLL